MNTDSGSLKFIHSDAGEICSAPHSITVNQPRLPSTMKA
jgi:hypothetical protein